MLLLSIDTFGFDPETKQPNCFQWHPETLYKELHDQFGVQPNRTAFDKLMAAINIVTTDLFFNNADRFIKLANVLSGDDFQPDTFDPADSLECAWAITEALLLQPPDDEDPEPFSDEVRHYVTSVLHDEGYIKPPDILRIALDADFSDKVRYNFEDDPEMFEGIYSVQLDKTEELQEVLKDNLLELADQLAVLPLRDGDTKEVVQRIGMLFRTIDGEKTADAQPVTFEKIARLFN